MTECRAARWETRTRKPIDPASLPRLKAWLTVRTEPAWRRDAFASGLEAAGYRVTSNSIEAPAPEDVIVTWNRQGSFHESACRFERAGAMVLVAENGYLGREDQRGGPWYAIARNQHNGAGVWPVGDGSRWASWGIKLAPWRPISDGHVLVLPQRGIGPSGVAMPQGWADRLKIDTDRPVRVRAHPGRAEIKPLDDDLSGAWCCVTWGSGAAIKALLAGIPVFHAMPDWIGGPAARLLERDVSEPFIGDRLPMFERMAWAQWTLAEIAAGDPFRRLLNAHTDHRPRHLWKLEDSR